MKYFIDTEFIEGFHKPLFGKKRHFIDLISVGIIAEDGREYYAVSNEFNRKNADKWVDDNVVHPIELELYKKLTPPEKNMHYYDKGDGAFKYLLKKFGKSNKQIAEDIVNFINPDLGFHCASYNNSEFRNKDSYLSKHFDSHNVKDFGEYYFAQPEFYGYYCDYDWVLFCSLFGRMIDLPKGFPMYCRDLKQVLDERFKLLNNDPCWKSLDEKLNEVKKRGDYPKQNNEHNALDDAKWNYELYKFLQKI
ncbi:MAG: 3'-5' exoribonuclease [Bacteroidota bacterium]